MRGFECFIILIVYLWLLKIITITAYAICFNVNFNFNVLLLYQVNTLIFPNLSAGNIAYKLLQETAGYEVIGPVLLGMNHSYHILQMGCSVREIINMIRIAVVDAQFKGTGRA